MSDPKQPAAEPVRARRPRPGRIRRLSFSLMTLFLLTAIVEIGLQAQRLWTGWGREPAKPTSSVYASHAFVHRVPTPGHFVDPKGYEETINSLGFRGPEVAVPKPRGLFRIACLGASTTIGTYQKHDRDAYPAVLEKLLREKRPARSIEVVNAGIAGAVSLQNVTNLLARVLPLEPDGIVLYDGYNDLKDAAPEIFRADWSHLPACPPPPRPTAFLVRLEIVRRILEVRDTLATLRQVAADDRGRGREFDDAERDPGRSSTVHEPARRAFRRSVKSIAALGRAHGARVALCTYASLLKREMGDAEKRASVPVLRYLPKLTFTGILASLDAYNDTVREAAREENALLIDVARDFPKDLDHFVEHVHHTDRGAARLASTVAQAILDAGWLDERGTPK